MDLPKTAVKPAHYFGLTFLLSWSIWIPLALSHFGIGGFTIPESTSNLVRLLGVLMPAASAVTLSALTGGSKATRSLGRRLLHWRAGWKWWLVAVAGQPALLVLAAILFSLVTGTKITPEPLASGSIFIVNLIALLIATLGEEIGWRGVALPALQAGNTAVKSSVILGLLWGAWHVPFWLMLDTFDQFGFLYLLLNFLFAVPLTIYITWIFNHSQGSILLAVMLHLTFNIVNTVLLPVTLYPGAFILLGILEWVVALLIIRHLET